MDSSADSECLDRLWIHVLHQLQGGFEKNSLIFYSGPEVEDECFAFSTVKWTRILRFSVSVLTQNGEVCSADASALSPDIRGRTWKSGNYFFEVVPGSGDDGADFLWHLCQTQVPGVPVQPGSQTLGCPAHIATWVVGSCGHTQ